MQDIPLNIAAFDDSLLEAREISDLAELGRNVPGLYVIDQGKRSANNIVVRGLNLDAFQSAEFLGNTGGNTVATYIGEIPLYVDLTMTDVERVEVLLGPQGTLYGAGTLGGAIRYIPHKPEFDTTVSVRGSTFALSESDSMGFRGGATFNVPFGDNLAFRASIDQYDDPGFIDTPYLVRESGVSDPEPNFANPTEVAANLYRDERRRLGKDDGSARRPAVATRRQRRCHVHLPLSEHGGRRTHAEPRRRVRHGAVRVGDAISGAERAAQRAAVGGDRRRLRLRTADVGHWLLEVRRPSADAIRPIC